MERLTMRERVIIALLLAFACAAWVAIWWMIFLAAAHFMVL